MGFVRAEQQPRVTLAIVALGTPARLATCFASLVAHESRDDFAIVCVINPITIDDVPDSIDIPEGVLAIHPAANLGWAGGLHAARAELSSEFFVWVQDDMTVMDGWLDALVDAADTHPSVGAFGSVGVDDAGAVAGFAAGRAHPVDDLSTWGATDTTKQSLPTDVTVADWITSKGMLVRTDAWDEVGGADPSLWPLNFVDLDFSTHLRCHGLQVALVPTARLAHGGSLSAPSEFREFLTVWGAARVSARWADALRLLESGRTTPVVHPCHHAADIELTAGREASRMLVPFARATARAARLALEREVAAVADAETRAHEANLAAAASVRDLHGAQEETRRALELVDRLSTRAHAADARSFTAEERANAADARALAAEERVLLLERRIRRLRRRLTDSQASPLRRLARILRRR